MHLKMTQTCRWSMFYMANTAIMPDIYIKNYNSILMTTFDVKMTSLISYGCSGCSKKTILFLLSLHYSQPHWTTM